MTPWTWAVVAVVGAAVLAAFARLGWIWWKRFHVPWRTVSPGLQLYSNGADVDPARVIAAVLVAQTALGRNGPWSPEAVRRATFGLRVYVRPTETWIDGHGRKVAGLSLGLVVHVGPSLAALCHEMAHVCDERLGRRVDYSHASWVENGIRAAVIEYETWLSEELAPD